MKRYILYTVVLSALLIINKQTLAQGSLPAYDDVVEYISMDDVQTLTDAEKTVQEGQGVYEKAELEYNKIAKLFSKKKTKKAEKKSVPAKLLRIEAYKKYEDGYTQTYQVYQAAVATLTFSYTDNKQKSEVMVEEANNNFTSATNIMETYKGMDKKALTAKPYNDVKRDLESAKEQMIKALEKLGACCKLQKQDVLRKQKDAADDKAWQEAQDENTIDSYQGYLSEFPNGKNATEARSLIDKLEEQAKLAALAAQNPKLIFKIQVAASAAKLDPSKLKAIYTGTDKINEENFPTERIYKYKYTMGSFDKYDDAKLYKAKIKVWGAFIVAYKDGARIDIKQALTNNKK